MKVIYDACQGQAALLTPQFTREGPLRAIRRGWRHEPPRQDWGLAVWVAVEGQAKASPYEREQLGCSSAERHPRKMLSGPWKGGRRSRGKARFSFLGPTLLGGEAGLRADSW